ncbi:uncharacterized protein [Atheta coriaria]|uniref:uncharacterized protein n=1 Tax=Dalotia coriaria TaxID=877792 RepID=UPI0031F389C4
MLEFHSEKLLNLCKDKIGVIRKMQTKTKIRLNMMLICMQVEDMQLYKRFGVKADVFKSDTKQELEKRPNLMKIYNVLKLFMSDLDVNRLEFEYQVPHFNVLGITGYRKNVYKAFVVEVLDESNRVKNVDEKMSGRLQVKTRLMYKMDLTVVLLNSADFEDLNDSELKEYVRREMSIVS